MHIPEKIATFCKTLKSHSLEVIAPADDLEAVECGYKSGHTPPVDGWQKVLGFKGAHKHWWVRFSIQTPPAQPRSRYILQCGTGITGRESMLAPPITLPLKLAWTAANP